MKLTKIIALVLSLATVLSMASFSAFAEEESYEYANLAFDVVGNHTVSPLDTADISVYGFTPDQIGVYHVTTATEGAVLYTFTGSEFFMTCEGVAADNTVVMEAKEGYIGNTFLFGVKAEGDVTVTITLTDEELSLTPNDMPWISYNNTSELQPFTLELEENQELEYVNVFEEHSAVLGEDGLYHLDGAEGPVLYFNFGSNAPYLSFGTALNYGRIGDYFYDEHGNFVEKIDFSDALNEHISCADEGIFPLTSDLIYILQTHGDMNGWYDEDTEQGYYLFEGLEGLVRDNAWMFACAYVVDAPAENESSDISEDSAENEGSSEEAVYALGDVNLDGTINSLDAATALKYDAVIIELSQAQMLVADVNGDSDINSLDAAQILKFDAQLITEFGGTANEDEPVYGTADLPHPVMAASDYVVAAGATVYFTLTYKNGMMLTATAGDFSEEILVTELFQDYSFTNSGTESVILHLEFTSPAGLMDNPIELVMGENLVEVAEGGQGMFYTWTASAAGTLKVEMPAGDWLYVINNLTTYIYGDYQYSDSDPVVSTATIEVAAGDEIQLMFNTYDPASPFTAPAGQLSVTVSFE
ncbi:MAG: dockerin type I repeat-containing protein [Clostridia bacterium]|nr:dockerin type I repeat-containing protein [Clostridia bacterium]